MHKLRSEGGEMRSIENTMWKVIKAKTGRKFGNMEVLYQPSTNSSWIYLHGNHIAKYLHGYGDVEVVEVNVETLAMWPTPTTKSRLRALGVDVTTKKGVTYLKGVEV